MANLPIIFNQVETIEYLSKQISDELIQLPAEIKKSEHATLKLIEIVHS
ncbi:hypothetical protein [Leuconostoc sp. MTCC 10508]|nr:hypothetical protein [Leuconostoc sp. MTCC 10508]